MNDRLRAGGPDYNRCLVNLSNSILKNFGAETTASTLDIADRYLDKGYKNVIVLLLDAMGESIVKKHLKEDGFFRSHLVDTYSSVYPPTTVAATTSLLSGLYPNEHGWLGWDVYYPQIDKNVTVFRNFEQITEETVESGPVQAADYNVANKYTPYKQIQTKISEAGSRGSTSMPYMEPYPKTFDDVLARAKNLCEDPGRQFVYIYWDEPDSTLHRTGTMSEESHAVLVDIEDKVKEWATGLSDTLLFITADHSHIDSKNLCLMDYPEVLDCLVRMPSLEPRTMSFFVKEECLEAFPEIFRRNFGDDFILLTREEVLKEKLFGPGEDRPGLSDSIGDYVALATSDTSIYITHKGAQTMPGAHAGLTAEESRIPLIVVES